MSVRRTMTEDDIRLLMKTHNFAPHYLVDAGGATIISHYSVRLEDVVNLVRLLEGSSKPSEKWKCWCRVCNKDRTTESGWPWLLTTMVTCPVCGDKRCQHAEDHRAICNKESSTCSTNISPS